MGEVGDVVVGRITEVGQKRWKVDLNSRQDAVLMLSSVNLPGGVQVTPPRAGRLERCFSWSAFGNTAKEAGIRRATDAEILRRKRPACGEHLRGCILVLVAGSSSVLQAEVQAFFSDGGISIHTRNLKYAKVWSLYCRSGDLPLRMSLVAAKWIAGPGEFEFDSAQPVPFLDTPLRRQRDPRAQWIRMGEQGR